MSVQAKYEELLKLLARPAGLVVAFSAGVDSTLLLKAAVTANSKVMAVTAVSALRPARVADEAKALAGLVGAEHRLLVTDELSLDGFALNPPERCYICKNNLCGKLVELAGALGYEMVAEGSNQDDSREYRPGMRAVKEWGVASPLAAVGLTKAEIRTLSRQLALPTWDKPSIPCLVTRFPYGTLLTRELLAKVESGENLLRELGFTDFRLRSHGDLARLEVSSAEFPQAVALKETIVERLRSIGYQHICLDLAGLRSGSFDSDFAS
ncbi:MAG: ATP-dependent sacrificial sulfur transferase LarE [Firmicutes bacterium]|nr:ATP-dependent sacrificial sulfur transferase LarE [Bacillota bacterium]